MIHDANVDRAIDSLIRIHLAGGLPTLEQRVGEEAGTVGDLERWPAWQADVELVARAAARLLDLPEKFCHDAVCQRLLPSTRRRIALEVIHELAHTLPSTVKGPAK